MEEGVDILFMNGIDGKRRAKWMQEELLRLGEIERAWQQVKKKVVPMVVPDDAVNTAVQTVNRRLDELLVAEGDASRVQTELLRLRGIELQYTELRAKMKVVMENAAQPKTPLTPGSVEHSQQTARLNSKIRALEKEVAAVQAENHALAHHDGLRVKCERLEKDYESEKLLRQQMQHEVLQMQRQVDRNADATELRQRLQESEIQIQRLREVEVQSQEHERKAQRASDLEVDCMKLKAQVTRLQQFETLYKSALQDAERAMEFQRENAQLQEELQLQKSERLTTQQQLASAQLREQQLTQHDRDNAVYSQVSERKMQNLLEETNEFRDQLHKATVRCAEETTRRQLADQEVKQLKDRVAALRETETQLGTLRDEHADVISELRQLKREKGRMEENRRFLERDQERMQQQLAQLQELKHFHFVPSLPVGESTLSARHRTFMT